eukprot:gnl/TRDRNA2_/TRDRNA2_155288_c1_seq1.p1 gnl/TRDRNA2_/TRDRNA2_155288_c1~~gnl/TRDRNA2_/TRDRNA2_155288_c1_seq1.p1  ORF type:complete len:304 (+),score=76.63 gnl/TRDRNA2_/TRDRNA2_155288_c1_seq1:28-912(+)
MRAAEAEKAAAQRELEALRLAAAAEEEIFEKKQQVAALRIQAIHRGQMARKELQRQQQNQPVDHKRKTRTHAHAAHHHHHHGESHRVHHRRRSSTGEHRRRTSFQGVAPVDEEQAAALKIQAAARKRKIRMSEAKANRQSQSLGEAGGRPRRQSFTKSDSSKPRPNKIDEGEEHEGARASKGKVSTPTAPAKSEADIIDEKERAAMKIQEITRKRAERHRAQDFGNTKSERSVPMEGKEEATVIFRGLPGAEDDESMRQKQREEEAAAKIQNMSRKRSTRRTGKKQSMGMDLTP